MFCVFYMLSVFSVDILFLLVGKTKQDGHSPHLPSPTPHCCEKRKHNPQSHHWAQDDPKGMKGMGRGVMNSGLGVALRF